MKYEPLNGVVNVEDKKIVDNIANLQKWAEINNHREILEMLSDKVIIHKPTNLKNLYYKALQMKKAPKTLQRNLSSEPSPTTIQEPVVQDPLAGQKPTEPEFNPMLQGNPKERAYATGQNVHGGDTIPEPTFEGAALGSGGGPGQTFNNFSQNEPDKKFEETANLPPAEKEKAAEDLAAFILGMYSTYVPLGYRAATKVSERYLMELATSGKIDSEMILEAPEGEVRAIQFLRNFNVKVDDSFTVTREWQDAIRPYIVEELKKAGAGMTPMQVILFMVITQNTENVVQVLQMKKDLKRSVDFMIEQTTIRNNGGGSYRTEPVRPATNEYQDMGAPTPPSGFQNTPPSSEQSYSPTASHEVYRDTQIIETHAEEIGPDEVD